MRPAGIRSGTRLSAGLRRFGGGTWGEGGVGVFALLSLSDEYEAHVSTRHPRLCPACELWFLTEREKAPGSPLPHLNAAELTLPMLLALKMLYNKERKKKNQG